MGNEIKDLPKTPLEEILFVVESTNDIVSKILEILNSRRMACFDEKCKKRITKE